VARVSAAEPVREDEAGELPRLFAEMRLFALPVLSAVVTQDPFEALWKPSGPWA
jgi:hypothetical protein